MLSATLLSFLLLFSTGQSAKILCVFHIPSYSHFILAERLLVELADRGHEVTMVSPFPQKALIKNYKDIFVNTAVQLKKHFARKTNMINTFAKMWYIEKPIFYAECGLDMTEEVFKTEEFQHLLAANTTFDLVITQAFANEAHQGLAHHFKASSIILCTFGSMAWIDNLVGNAAPTSYVPNIFLSYSTDMSIFQRLFNTFYYLYDTLCFYAFYLEKQNAMLKKYIPNSPHLKKLMYNTSIVLLNSHPSLSDAKPLLPNMIEVGGFHIKEDQTLPGDLQRFMDEATEGVVYFSMGSNVKTSEFSLEKRDAIMRVFSKLKMKVLWKFEDENFENKPGNVYISKWFPQYAILAHPNTKLFITHGGLLSITEAIYFGVPILGIPILGDQDMNMVRAEKVGYGLKLAYSDLKYQEFHDAIQEMLNNQKYRNEVKRRSLLMRDRPLRPLEEAVYWTEFVIRHQGAPHFRSAALDLMWYQYYLLDCLVLLGIILYVVVYLLRCVMCKLYMLTENKQKIQ